MLKYSTIAALTGFILFSIIKVKEESPLAEIAAYTCGFILVCKAFYSVYKWMRSEDDLNKSPL